MQILAEWIKNAAHKIQVIISTHSPDLSVKNVLCFERQDKSHFTIKPLSTSELSSKIEEGWQLGDLYRIASVGCVLCTAPLSARFKRCVKKQHGMEPTFDYWLPELLVRGTHPTLAAFAMTHKGGIYEVVSNSN